MNINKHVLWAEKYRPTDIEDYIFQNSTHKKSFNQMIEHKTIPHLLLSGVQGSGKTTIAEILIRALDVDSSDVLVINASDENSVDIMRDKIRNFVTTFAMGEFKIVQLEEADYLTLAAQSVLRKYMEEPNCPARFILTCNYENKIMPAIKSRSQQFKFKASDKDAIAERLAVMLITEGIEFDIDLLDNYIAVGYPDIRKIIQLLQQNSINGVLQSTTLAAETGDYQFKILDLIGVDNWTQVRTLACENVAREEWEDFYRFLFDNLRKSKKFSDENKHDAALIVLAEFLYKHASIADPEINATAMFIKLSQI